MRFQPFLKLVVLCILSVRAAFCSSEAEAVEDAWGRLHPEVFKRVEVFELTGNPFQGRSGLIKSVAPSGTLSEGVVSRVSKALAEAIRGLVPGGDDACVLLGSRILRVGQELWLSEQTWGERLPGCLRLRQVLPGRVVFVCDERLRRQTGLEEWVVCPGNGGRIR